MLIDPYQIANFISNMHLFGKLDEEQRNLVVESFNQHLYHAGDVIYEAGSEPNLFYIVYQGAVRVERLVEGELDYIVTLESSDYFGQEALTGTEYRQATVTAHEDTILLELDNDAIAEIEKQIPDLGLRLRLLARSFDLTWRAPRGWREVDEVIYYMARRHPFYLVIRMISPVLLALVALVILIVGESMGSLLTPILLSGGLLLIAALWGVWNFIDWTNDYYILTDRRVLYLERILFLYDSRTESPMDAVLSVNQRTTWYSRPLHFGDVTVKTFTGTVPLRGIAEPQEVQALIERLLLRARSRKSREDMRKIARTLGGRINPAPAPPPAGASGGAGSSAPIEPAVTPGILQRALANLFHTRWEQNGVITYRKHWWELVKNIWAPALSMLAILALIVMRLVGYLDFISLRSALLILFLLGLIVGFWLWYQYADWGNDVYVITADQIIDVYKKPIGTETRKAAPIKNILSIEYQRLGLLGYLLNFGTVFIKIGEATFDFEYVYNPSEVQRELFKRYNEFKYRERLSQEQADANRMADWLEVYHKLSGGTTGPVVPPPPPTAGKSGPERV